MANVKPEQVFVVATSNVTATTGGAENHAAAFASPPLTGELYAFGDNNAVINTAVAIPERVQFGVGDPVRVLRLSDYIRKGYVEKYTVTPFASKTPLVWKIDLSTLSATGFNVAADPINSITLMIQYRKTSMDFCMQKIQVTLKDKGALAANATELARLINESVTEQLMQNQWKPISAYVSANVVYVHETQMPADFSGINTPNQFIFDLSASSSFNATTAVQEDYWTQLGGDANTIVRTFYAAPVSPIYLVYNQTGKFWAQSTALGTPYVTTSNSNVNLTGNGLPILIKSNLRETDWGYAGVQNRTHYADTGYDTVNSAFRYNTHIIEYYEDSQVEMGSNTGRRKAKRLIIYVPVEADLANASTFLTSFINALLGNPTNTMHI